MGKNAPGCVAMAGRERRKEAGEGHSQVAQPDVRRAMHEAELACGQRRRGRQRGPSRRRGRSAPRAQDGRSSGAAEHRARGRRAGDALALALGKESSSVSLSGEGMTPMAVAALVTRWAQKVTKCSGRVGSTLRSRSVWPSICA